MRPKRVIQHDIPTGDALALRWIRFKLNLNFQPARFTCVHGAARLWRPRGSSKPGRTGRGARLTLVLVLVPANTGEWWRRCNIDRWLIIVWQLARYVQRHLTSR